MFDVLDPIPNSAGQGFQMCRPKFAFALATDLAGRSIDIGGHSVSRQEINLSASIEGLNRLPQVDS